MLKPRKIMCLITALMVLSLLPCVTSFAEESATTDDVYELILNAVKVLEELGEEGLGAFIGAKNEFIYKNAYVLVTDCATMKMVAHPNKKLIGIDLTNHQDRNPDPAKRKYVNRDTCELGKRPNGGWVEYYWNKPGSEEIARKVGFSLQVPGTDYVVISSIYDDTTSVADLNASLK